MRPNNRRMIQSLLHNDTLKDVDCPPKWHQRLLCTLFPQNLMTQEVCQCVLRRRVTQRVKIMGQKSVLYSSEVEILCTVVSMTTVLFVSIVVFLISVLYYFYFSRLLLHYILQRKWILLLHYIANKVERVLKIFTQLQVLLHCWNSIPLQ